MSFQLDNYFEKHSENEWLQVALKSLKLDSKSELDKYLNSHSIENFTYHLNPPRDISSIHLNTFPAEIFFTREINNGQSNLEKSELGVETLLSTHPTVVHKGQELFQVLNTAEKTHFGDLVLVDVLSIAEEFSDKSDKLEPFLCKKLRDKNTHLLIDGAKLHNSGLNMCSELALTLHLALKYSDLVHTHKKKIYFVTATDSMFFSNISKLRALRYMFETILENSGLVARNTFKIIAKPSLRETTLYTPWTNALRSTVSVAGHMIAGADYSVGSSHNALEQRVTLEEIDGLGLRQSRNVFNILKEESGLKFVKDPSQGSYIIEDLTKQLIVNSFDELKKIEDRDINDILYEYSERAKVDSHLRQESVNDRSKTVCGVNDFSDVSETVHKKIKLESFQNLDSELYPLRRDSKPIETLRFKTSKNPALSKKHVLILTSGELKSINARINFCENYFEVLGLKTSTCDISVASKIELDKYCAIVYCSSDEHLGDLVERFPPKAKLRNFVAGKKFKHEGLQNIFQGQNIFNVLSKLVEGEL